QPAAEFLPAARERDIALIFLVAPTSDDERICRIAEQSNGFVYAVSVTGTTGARDGLDPQLPAYLERIRRSSDTPVAVGFGISSPNQIRALRGRADGVVIGSRLVNAIDKREDLTGLIQSLK